MRAPTGLPRTRTEPGWESAGTTGIGHRRPHDCPRHARGDRTRRRMRPPRDPGDRFRDPGDRFRDAGEGGPRGARGSARDAGDARATRRAARRPPAPTRRCSEPDPRGNDARHDSPVQGGFRTPVPASGRRPGVFLGEMPRANGVARREAAPAWGRSTHNPWVRRGGRRRGSKRRRGGGKEHDG